MKRIFYILLWCIVVISLIMGQAFTNRHYETTLCKKVEINIMNRDNNSFVDTTDILEMLRNNGLSPILSTPLNKINTNMIENLIKKHPSIDSAEVFITIDGCLVINILQRNPILRVFNFENESYYIDENGKIMPLSKKYTARVLSANGYIFQPKNFNRAIDLFTYEYEKLTFSPSLLSKLYTLALYINKDKFWKSQITQIYVNEKQEFELIPRVGNHIIILGDINNMDEKFKKLFIFYKKGLNNIGWSNYGTINLKYQNQIVCSTR